MEASQWSEGHSQEEDRRLLNQRALSRDRRCGQKREVLVGSAVWGVVRLRLAGLWCCHAARSSGSRASAWFGERNERKADMCSIVVWKTGTGRGVLRVGTVRNGYCKTYRF